MQFVYGAVPTDPAIPYSSLWFSPGCETHGTEAEVFLLAADLGRNPIPYALIDLEDMTLVEDMAPHVKARIEKILVEMYGSYMGLRN
jgi:hypothetical protein